MSRRTETKFPELLEDTTLRRARDIRVYESSSLSKDSKAERWGVPKIACSVERKVLVCGTGRSGSMTMSKAFKKRGLDVGHEQTGLDGTSTHFYHSDHYWYPMFPWNGGRKAHCGERLSDFSFQNTIHVVRNPLTAIPSISAIFGSIDFEFLIDLGMIPDKLPDSRIVKCAHVYHAINAKIDSQKFDMRVRLEELSTQWNAIEALLGMDHEGFPEVHANKGSGYRRSTPLPNLSVVEHYDKLLARSISKMARRYGYA